MDLVVLELREQKFSRELVEVLLVVLFVVPPARRSHDELLESLVAFADLSPKRQESMLILESLYDGIRIRYPIPLVDLVVIQLLQQQLSRDLVELLMVEHSFWRDLVESLMAVLFVVSPA